MSWRSVHAYFSRRGTAATCEACNVDFLLTPSGTCTDDCSTQTTTDENDEVITLVQVEQACALACPELEGPDNSDKRICKACTGTDCVACEFLESNGAELCTACDADLYLWEGTDCFDQLECDA
jgi:hypothetical protein